MSEVNRSLNKEFYEEIRITYEEITQAIKQKKQQYRNLSAPLREQAQKFLKESEELVAVLLSEKYVLIKFQVKLPNREMLSYTRTVDVLQFLQGPPASERSKKVKLSEKPLRMVNKLGFGLSLHAALRKACDSSQSGVAWNLIRIIPASIYEEYWKFMYNSASGYTLTATNAHVVFKAAAFAYLDRMDAFQKEEEDNWDVIVRNMDNKDFKTRKHRAAFRKLLGMSMDALSEEDFKGIADFVTRN